jgi:alpha-beta hydrolase superfamily lysophospholipase
MRKSMAALLGGVTGVVGALIAREAWQRERDHQHFEEGRDYWRLYLPAEDVRWTDAHLRTYRIPSGHIGIHLDVYAQDEAAAPAIVIAPGMLTYGRLYVTLARSFYERGYTVVCPDYPGTGFSGGTRGDGTAGESVAAVVEATLWARQHFDGPIYLLGLSLGGAIAYAAAAAGAPVSAISCVDLFTFDDMAALRQLVAQPRILDLLPLARAMAIPLGWVRLPADLVHRMDEIVAPEESDRLAVWRFDPLVPRMFSLRSLVSAATTPPRVSLERNTIPTLVINQEHDHVLDPAVTSSSFERLGGPKQYVALPDSAHWSFERPFWEVIVGESDRWFRAYRAGQIVHEPALKAGEHH